MPSLPNNPYSRTRRHPLASLFVLILWLAALWLVFVNRQDLFDWWHLRNYTAPATVASLARQDSMNDYARKVFYVNHPAVETKSEFFKDCPSGQAEQTIVLGCYHSGQTGIFLQDVTDPRLKGVEQVTAAHEMLHAAYERLNKADRDSVDKMLLDYYHNGLHDRRILKTIDAYKQTEPNDLVNEMHSVFGTEVAQLPTPLENYYKRYFTDRSKVAAFAAGYQKAFTAIPSSIDHYKAQLESIKVQTTTLEADLKKKQSYLSSQRNKLIKERNSTSPVSYNSDVNAYNAEVDVYNSERQQYTGLINSYNHVVERINTLATEQKQLVNELSNDTAPINH